MKIQPFNQVNQAYRPAPQQIHKQEPLEKRCDQIEISEAAKEMQSTNASRTREAEVAALKKKIEQGEYEVDARAVAHRFFEFWDQ